jgi:hypothetical protein
MVRLRTVILAALALAAFAPSLAQGPPPPQLWKRQGGVLSPRRAGDSVAIGTTVLVAHPGDGVDAAPIIQAKIDALAVAGGGTVVLAPGTFRVATRIELKSNVHVRGSGRYSTLLKPDAALTGATMQASGSVESRLSNITVSDLGFDGTNIADVGQAFAGVRFNWTDYLEVRNIYQLAGHGIITLRACTHFRLVNIQGRDMPEGSIAFFSETRDGLVEGLDLQNVGEAVDFFNNDNILVTNIVASGREGAFEDEAFDISTSRRITISNAVVQGFYVGALIKTEGTGDRGWSDIKLANCHFTGFQTYGVIAQGSAATLPTDRLTITDSVFISTEAGAKGLSLTPGYATGSDWLIQNNYVDTPDIGIEYGILSSSMSGLTVQGNTVKSARFAIRIDGGSEERVTSGIRVIGNRAFTTTATASHSAIYIGNGQDMLFEGNEVLGSTAHGIEIKNALRPVVRGNLIHDVGYDGLRMMWNSTSGLHVDDAVIAAVVDGNIIRRWSTVGAARAGIRFDVSLGAEETGTYNMASVSNNRLYLDGSVAASGQFGIYFEKGSLTSLDYIKCDNNLIYNVPTPLSTAALGANSTQENNMIFARP